MKAILNAIVIAGLTAMSAQAALKVNVAHSEDGSRPLGVVFIDGDRIRMEVVHPATDASRMHLLFGTRPDALVMVDYHREGYMIIDREKMEGMARMVNDIYDSLEERLKAVPASQRARIEGILRESMPEEPAAAAQFSVTESGEQDTVNDIDVKKYQLLRDGELTAAVWTASWRDLDLQANSLDPFYRMAAFQEEMLSTFKNAPAGAKFQRHFSELQNIVGFPLKVEHYENGSVSETTYFIPEKVDSLDPASFEIPAGFTPIPAPDVPEEYQ